MTHIKQFFDISSNYSFYMLLAFLFLINFSIAGCYIFFTLLLINLIIDMVKNKKLPPVPKYFKFFLLYIFFSLISTVFSLNPLESFKDNREFFIFLLIPTVLLIINSRKRLELSLYTVLGSAVLSSLVGIVDIIRKGISLDHRLTGLTSHWMTYSGLLMFAFVFFSIQIFYNKNKKHLIIIFLCLIPVLASIFLSLTRSVWVGIFIALAAFIIYYQPKILYAAVPAALVLLLILPSSVRSRLESTFDLDNETNRDRIYMAQTGFTIFKKYPLTGVGPNNIKRVYDQYKPTDAKLSNPHLHNNLIHILAERGLFSFLSLIAAFIAVFIYIVKKIKEGPPEHKPIAVGALFAFISFFVAGLFEYNFGDTEIKFILFFFLSIPFVFNIYNIYTADKGTPAVNTGTNE